MECFCLSKNLEYSSDFQNKSVSFCHEVFNDSIYTNTIKYLICGI